MARPLAPERIPGTLVFFKKRILAAFQEPDSLPPIFITIGTSAFPGVVIRTEPTPTAIGMLGSTHAITEDHATFVGMVGETTDDVEGDPEISSMVVS